MGNLLKPEYQCPKTACPEHLLRSPEFVRHLRRSDLNDEGERQTDRPESRSVQRMCWLYQSDQSLSQRRKGCLQNSQFADPGMLGQEFDQPTEWPTTTRPLRRQRGVAGVNRVAVT